MVILDLRGRDLVIIPSENMLSLPPPDLLRTLFGVYLPGSVRNSMSRDKQRHYLRTLPIHFPAINRALQRLGVAFSGACEERPALP